MHKHFKLHVWALLANFFNLVKAEFARQDDALHAHVLPKLHRRPVDGVGLHREVNVHLGPLLAHHHDEARVGHDEGVGLHRDDGFDVTYIGAHLVVVRQQVAGQKELFATRMGFGNADANLLKAELVVARAQAVTGLAGIHGVCAEVVSGAHFVERTCGEQELGCFECGHR